MNRPAVGLALWTLLVWTTRIRNIWTDDALTTGGQVARTALAAVFTALAVAVLVHERTIRRRSGSMPPIARVALPALAAWTTGVWIVRGAQIALADHEAAFVVVHIVLAVVSISLAAWALAADRATPVDASPPTAMPAER